MTMQIIKSDGNNIQWANCSEGMGSALSSIGTLIPWELSADSQWNSIYLHSIHEQDTVEKLTQLFESNCVGYISRVDIVKNPGTRRRSAFIHFTIWGFNWFSQQLRQELENARNTVSGCKITDPNINNWIYSIAINHKPIVCEPLNLVQLTANDQEMSARLIAQQSKIDELMALVADLRQKFEGLSQGTNASSMPSLSQGTNAILSPLTTPNSGPPMTLDDLDTSSRRLDFV
jgi:hypothetical protein